MITINGLPAFFDYMNRRYHHWVLVGGCAAWMHLARAPRDMTQDPGVYREIFPVDIEVVIVGNVIDPEVEVQIGTRGPLRVEFLHNNEEATTIEHDRVSVKISGANVLPIADIIHRYEISTSEPSKMAKRMTRVYMLKELSAERMISPDLAMQQFNTPPELGGIAAAAAAMRLKREARLAKEQKKQ